MERFYNLLAVARATDSVERPARRDDGSPAHFSFNGRTASAEPTRASPISLSISGWTGGVSAAVLMIPVGPSAVIMMVPVGLSAPGLAALAAGYCAQLIALVLP
jgi:hypothetical protein